MCSHWKPICLAVAVDTPIRFVQWSGKNESTGKESCFRVCKSASKSCAVQNSFQTNCNLIILSSLLLPPPPLLLPPHPYFKSLRACDLLNRGRGFHPTALTLSLSKTLQQRGKNSSCSHPQFHCKLDMGVSRYQPDSQACPVDNNTQKQLFCFRVLLSVQTEEQKG